MQKTEFMEQGGSGKQPGGLWHQGFQATFEFGHLERV